MAHLCHSCMLISTPMPFKAQAGLGCTTPGWSGSADVKKIGMMLSPLGVRISDGFRQGL
jgi:hypothetical protein